MQKTILVTGSTDGIGLQTAIMLTKMGHCVLLHGRNAQKLFQVASQVLAVTPTANIDIYVADLSLLADVEALVTAISQKHSQLDVLINNAGVYSVADNVTAEGLDARFVVNTIAPYLLTQGLLPLMNTTGRVVNVSSAAQTPLVATALTAPSSFADNNVYAQSKLALTMWSVALAKQLANIGPAVIAVNPKSLLGSKMVKQAYGISGGDLTIGADILTRAALSDEFANASGKYFDNDIGQFALPHSDATNDIKCQQIIDTLNAIIKFEK